MSATSWNSELPSGRNPFWIKDEALVELGLHRGDAVGVDTRREAVAGDLVLVEVETDELADRLVRRFQPEPSGQVRLTAAAPGASELLLEPEQLLVLGVVCTRVRFEAAGADSLRVVEEPL
jgi:SOS-response transcriptional repressor LexA